MCHCTVCYAAIDSEHIVNGILISEAFRVYFNVYALFMLSTYILHLHNCVCVWVFGQGFYGKFPTNIKALSGLVTATMQYMHHRG